MRLSLFYDNPQQPFLIVGIFLDKESNKFRYVNITKGHICHCQFDTKLDALKDLLNYPEITGVRFVHGGERKSVQEFIDNYIQISEKELIFYDT